MQNLIKESKRLYKEFQHLGPKFLDNFDYKPITDYTLEAFKQKSVIDYINQNLTINQQISMLPIQFEPDNSFALAIFTLAPGITMPLHDHPEMFVLSYVLHGNGEREGWNIKDSELNKVLNYKKSDQKQSIDVEAEELARLQLKTGDICYTTPNKCNLHSFINKSTSDPFIFLDVIVPHYDPNTNRIISYFKKKQENLLQSVHEDEYIFQENLGYEQQEYIIQQ